MNCFKIVRNSLIIVKDLIISPRKAFCTAVSKKFKKEIFLLFLLGTIFPIYKAFNRKSYAVNFWEDDRINHFFTLLGTPRITLIVAYLSFFIFLFLLVIFCKFFFKNKSQKDLIFYMLSINGIGVFLQIIFYYLDLILSYQLVFVFSYIVFIWVLLLSVLAIKVGQNTNFLKAMAIYLISALPVYIIAGLPGLLPSLIWIA